MNTDHGIPQTDTNRADTDNSEERPVFDDWFTTEVHFERSAAAF